MVFGIFSDCDSAELALMDFGEIGIGMRDVSAFSSNQQDLEALGTFGQHSAAVTNSHQPFLQEKLSTEQWQVVIDAIKKGGIVLAITDDKIPQEVIGEMLVSHKASLLITPEGGV